LSFLAPRFGATAGPFFLAGAPEFRFVVDAEDAEYVESGRADENVEAVVGGVAAIVSTYAAGTRPSLTPTRTLIHPDPSVVICQCIESKRGLLKKHTIRF
jgi:hypothetical protein